MKIKFNVPMKIDKETHKEMKRLRRELSLLEGRDISLGEINRRIIKGEDIPRRLKIGAFERRKGIKDEV